MNSLPPPIPPSNYETSFGAPLRNDRQAIASLVCGIVGLLFFGVILGTVALVLGSKARARINAQPERLKGSGMALAGMVLGAIDLVAFVLLVAA